MGKTGKKINNLSIKDKIEVIKLREQNHSVKDLCQKFNCGKSQIYEAIKKKEELLKDYEKGSGSTRKRKRPTENADIDQITLEWFLNVQAMDLPVPKNFLQIKAKEIAEKLGKNSFKASNGWLTSFLNRHHISPKQVSGASKKVPEEKVTEEKTDKIPSLIAGYEPKDIYNCVETGLFYRGIPTKSLFEEGKLPSKERLTILLCCSMSGDIEKPLVIGKAENPPCFQNIDISMLPAIWRSQTNAVMTSSLMEDWLNVFNSKMARENRRVLLFWDCSPCHKEIELSNVKLVFLPSNPIWKTQPLDLGVIKMMKTLYKKYFLHSLIARIDATSSTSQLIKTISLLDAVKWIGRACTEIAKSPEKISRCFKKAGFIINNNDDQVIENLADQKQNEAELQALINDASYLLGSEIMDVADYVMAEDEICVLESNISIDYIIQQHKELEADEDTEVEESDEEEASIQSYQEALKIIKHLEIFYLRQSNKELMPVISELQFETEKHVVNEKCKQILL